MTYDIEEKVVVYTLQDFCKLADIARQDGWTWATGEDLFNGAKVDILNKKIQGGIGLLLSFYKYTDNSEDKFVSFGIVKSPMSTEIFGHYVFPSLPPFLRGINPSSRSLSVLMPNKI